MTIKAYRTAEVAERLQVSAHTVRRWIDDGILMADHTAGGQARITEDAIQAYLHRKHGPRPHPCQVLAVANQKGGAAKTTTAVALAAALVDEGNRVLLMDADPQANATDGVGFDRDQPYTGLHDAIQTHLDDGDASLSVVPVEPNWDLVPSHIGLAGMETEIVMKAVNKVTILQGMVDALRPFYDWIIIDCGPSLGWVTLNALTAADWVLIPQIPDSINAQGLGQLYQTIRRVQKWTREGQPVAVLGVVLMRVRSVDHHQQMRGQIAAFCDKNNIPFLSARTEEERRANRPDQVEVPETIGAADAFGQATALSRYPGGGAARHAYRKLAQIVSAQVIAEVAAHV